MSYGGPPLNHSNPNYYPPAPPGHSQGPPPFNQPPQNFQQQSQYHQTPSQGGFPPQGGYPQQQGFQQQGGFPPEQRFPQGYPQQHGGFPPQQGYGAPPNQYPPQGYGPPPGQYPQQQTPPNPPSPGYDIQFVAQGDATQEAERLRKAMKGMGTDNKALIEVLSRQDPLRINLIRRTFDQRFMRSLESDITKETSSWFQEGLLACARGPLLQDVHNVRKAIAGVGTKEAVLNDVLLGRSNADMRAIKQTYQQTFDSSMEEDVKKDLSMKTERLFIMAMAATRNEDSAPIIKDEIDRDVTELHHATDGKIGTDEITVCSILTSRSDPQLRTIVQQFQAKYHITLEKIIEKEFAGHMENALVLLIGRANDRAMTDAVQLEETMRGMGTKDELLMNRVARLHWDRTHTDQVKKAYQFKFKKQLIERIKDETSRDQEKLLLAMLS